VKFRAGDLEFNASVVESGQAASPQTGNPLQTMTIQFRAQKAGMHEAAVTEALQRQSGGLFSLADADQPEREWRVRESNWTYVGSEPWGINHHVWRIEQVERIVCTRLRLDDRLELEPYDYVEQVTPEGRLRLAARALVGQATLDELASLALGGAVEVVRVGISEVPRTMRLSGYVWGERPDSLAVVVACEDLHEPRVTLAGFDAALVDELQDLIDVLGINAQELRRRRHARRHVANVDAWPLSD
jgi:hypothetical protein